MAFYSKTIREGDATASGVAGVGPVAGFEQDGVEHAELYDFAGDAVDFDPVAKANSIFAHQHEPTDEADDEIFQRNGEAGAGEAEERAEVGRRTEDAQ